MKTLSSTREIIEALGGPNAVAAMTGRSYKSVMRWRTTNARFPSVTYLVIQRALMQSGMTAPAHLWHGLASEAA